MKLALKKALSQIPVPNENWREQDGVIYLRPLDFGKIKIKACDGSRTIAESKEIFKGFIDENFKSWGLDKKCPATPECGVSSLALVENATLKQILSWLKSDMDKICWSQDQIAEICDEFRSEVLSPIGATLLPFKEEKSIFGDKEKYFVASVRVYSSSLYVHVSRLSGDLVWGASGGHRLVTPLQLNA